MLSSLLNVPVRGNLRSLGFYNGFATNGGNVAPILLNGILGKANYPY
jgi:hypothetical protein